MTDYTFMLLIAIMYITIIALCVTMYLADPFDHAKDILT